MLSPGCCCFCFCLRTAATNLALCTKKTDSEMSPLCENSFNFLILSDKDISAGNEISSESVDLLEEELVEGEVIRDSLDLILPTIVPVLLGTDSLDEEDAEDDEIVDPTEDEGSMGS